MDDNHGWIALHRKIQDGRFWQEKRKFSRAEAWIDILMEARWKEEPGQILIDNTLIVCNRGQVCYSMDTWATRWGWNRSATRRFFSLLKNLRQIDLENVTKTTRVTVENYERYQSVRPPNDHEVTSKRPASDQQVTTTEQGNKVKKVTKKQDPPDFVLFWTAYPRKVGKGAARKSWLKKHPPVNQVLSAIEAAKKTDQWRRDDGQFIPHPSTWFNQERWLDGDMAKPVVRQDGRSLHV